jgi:hypothetical protein
MRVKCILLTFAIIVFVWIIFSFNLIYTRYIPSAKVYRWEKHQEKEHRKNFGIPDYLHVEEEVSFSIKDADQFASLVKGKIFIRDEMCIAPLFRIKGSKWSSVVPAEIKDYVFVNCNEKVNLLVNHIKNETLSQQARASAIKYPDLALQNIVIITLDALSRAR